jgi:copper transport protein
MRTRRAGWPARLVRIAATVVLALGLVVGVAVAHGAAATGVLEASPAPGAVTSGTPSELRMRFVAPVEGRFAVLELWQDGRVVSGRARVDAADGQVIGASMPRIALAAGTAWVRYRVLTGDGHVLSGRYEVDIQAPVAAGAPPATLGATPGAWVTAIVRGLVITGLVIALGLVVLRWGVTGPAWQIGGVVPPGRSDDGEAFRSRTALALVAGGRAWWATLSAAVCLWGAGVVCSVVGLCWWLGVGAGGLGPLLAHTRTGHALVMLLVLCGAGALVAAVLARRAEGAVPAPPIGWGLALGLPAAVGILVMSWQGHASDGTDASINIPADAIHTIATAAWIGGLLGLLVLLVTPAQGLPDADRVRLLAGAVVRFSALAITSVTLLVVTGTYRALAALSSLGQLVDTAYGLALMTKLIIFAVMLLAGGYSRIVLHPRLERAALGLDSDDRGASRALRTSLRAELGLAGALMIAVTVLLALTPPG